MLRRSGASLQSSRAATPPIRSSPTDQSDPVLGLTRVLIRRRVFVCPGRALQTERDQVVAAYEADLETYRVRTSSSSS
jgi:hypothetical protein